MNMQRISRVTLSKINKLMAQEENRDEIRAERAKIKAKEDDMIRREEEFRMTGRASSVRERRELAEIEAAEEKSSVQETSVSSVNLIPPEIQEQIEQSRNVEPPVIEEETAHVLQLPPSWQRLPADVKKHIAKDLGVDAQTGKAADDAIKAALSQGRAKTATQAAES